MSKYEELKSKADKCRQAAKNTRGYMSNIWLSHALQLEAKADAMTRKQAEGKGGRR